MTAPSDNLDDLQSDIGHVSVLMETICDIAIEIPMPDDDSIAKRLLQVQALLWIARDLSTHLGEAVEACQSKAMRERRGGKAVRS